MDLFDFYVETLQLRCNSKNMKHELQRKDEYFLNLNSHTFCIYLLHVCEWQWNKFDSHTFLSRNPSNLFQICMSRKIVTHTTRGLARKPNFQTISIMEDYKRHTLFAQIVWDNRKHYFTIM